jgi:hypothetical protein
MRSRNQKSKLLMANVQRDHFCCFVAFATHIVRPVSRTGRKARCVGLLSCPRRLAF